MLGVGLGRLIQRFHQGGQSKLTSDFCMLQRFQMLTGGANPREEGGNKVCLQVLLVLAFLFPWLFKATG